MFVNKTPVANEQGRLYNIDTGIAGDKVFPQSKQKCQKIEDAFLDTISRVTASRPRGVLLSQVP